MSNKKSPIKWVGGKRWLAPRIQEMYKNHQDKRFVELFAGGLGASFYMEPKRVLANDINTHLISFYYFLQEEGKPEGLIKTNTKWNFYENTEETFYKNRERFNQLTRNFNKSSLDKESLTPYWKEQSELFYYLNRTAFNGLYRVNKKGEFNAPFGKYKNPIIERDLSVFYEIIKDWEFSCSDFKDVQFKNDDFIFSDSPYDDTFEGYSADGFSWDDQVYLASNLARLDNPVVITNNATDRIIELYTDLGFSYELIERRGKINTYCELKKKAIEIFAYKNI